MPKNAIVEFLGDLMSPILQDSGDNLSARVKKTDRQVLKTQKNNGKHKYSATRYPNGTVVETKTTKK